MPGVVLIVSIPDICLLPYLLYSHEYQHIILKELLECHLFIKKIIKSSKRLGYDVGIM